MYARNLHEKEQRYLGLYALDLFAESAWNLDKFFLSQILNWLIAYMHLKTPNYLITTSASVDHVEI